MSLEVPTFLRRETRRRDPTSFAMGDVGDVQVVGQTGPEELPPSAFTQFLDAEKNGKELEASDVMHGEISFISFSDEKMEVRDEEEDEIISVAYTREFPGPLGGSEEEMDIPEDEQDTEKAPESMEIPEDEQDTEKAPESMEIPEDQQDTAKASESKTLEEDQQDTAKSEESKSESKPLEEEVLLITFSPVRPEEEKGIAEKPRAFDTSPIQPVPFKSLLDLTPIKAPLQKRVLTSPASPVLQPIVIKSAFPLLSPSNTDESSRSGFPPPLIPLSAVHSAESSQESSPARKKMKTSPVSTPKTTPVVRIAESVKSMSAESESSDDLALTPLIPLERLDDSPAALDLSLRPKSTSTPSQDDKAVDTFLHSVGTLQSPADVSAFDTSQSLFSQSLQSRESTGTQ